MNVDCRREPAKRSNPLVNMRIVNGSDSGSDNSNAKSMEGAQTTTHRTMHDKSITIPGLFNEGRVRVASSLDWRALSVPSVLRKLPRRMRRRESS